MRPLNYEEVKSAIATSTHHGLAISILLDRPQSDMNIAHIFRLADATDIKHIYILTPPEHLNWHKIEKLSRKNSRHIPFTILDSVEQIIKLKPLIGLEWTNQSHSVFTCKGTENKMTLVIGNEQKGIQEAILSKCDHSIHIPMYGLHSSMNMAMAASVAIYQLISKKM